MEGEKRRKRKRMRKVMRRRKRQEPVLRKSGRGGRGRRRTLRLCRLFRLRSVGISPPCGSALRGGGVVNSITNGQDTRVCRANEVKSNTIISSSS